MGTYNGWTNYETWAWKLWIDNEQGTQEYWLAEAKRTAHRKDARYELAEALKTEAEENAPTVTGPYADLMSAAIGLINFREIAGSLLDEYNECISDDVIGGDL